MHSTCSARPVEFQAVRTLLDALAAGGDAPPDFAAASCALVEASAAIEARGHVGERALVDIYTGDFGADRGLHTLFDDHASHLRRMIPELGRLGDAWASGVKHAFASGVRVGALPVTLAVLVLVTLGCTAQDAARQTEVARQTLVAQEEKDQEALGTRQPTPTMLPIGTPTPTRLARNASRRVRFELTRPSGALTKFPEDASDADQATAARELLNLARYDACGAGATEQTCSVGVRLLLDSVLVGNHRTPALTVFNEEGLRYWLQEASEEPIREAGFVVHGPTALATNVTRPSGKFIFADE